MAATFTSLEELLARLRAAARLAERVHKESLVLLLEETVRLLSKGDVRGAAGKAWTAYRSFLGLLLVSRLLPEIEREVNRMVRERGVGKAKEYVEWWIKVGFLVSSTRQELTEIVKKLVKVTGDWEIAEKRRESVHLRVFFHYGSNIAEISEKEAAEAV